MNSIKKTLFCLFFYLLATFVNASIEITEVMYAPINGSEWVELYNSDNFSVNISNCLFYGKELSNIIIQNGSFLIITNNPDQFISRYGENFTIFENSFYHGLKNSGELINLSGNENCNGSFDYTDYVDNNNNNDGKTLEKTFTGDWKISLVDGGTPGKENSVYRLSSEYSRLEITEVMVDPLGDDADLKPLGEWVEIFNPGEKTIYLGDLILYDLENNHELYLTNSNVDNLELCAGCYTTIYRNGDSDFDLSKINDQVRLFYKDTLIDKVSFSQASEGNSFSKFSSGWFKGISTPGKENVYTSGCDWELKMEIDNSIFGKNDLNFKVIVNRNLGEAINITVKGRVEDYFGRVVKEYFPWKNAIIVNSNSKSYSPNLKEGIYRFYFWIEGLTCQDFKLDNNKIEQIIVTNPEYQKNYNYLEIEKLYLGSDEKVEWADQFIVKVNLYKGNETKTAVELWAEKDGEVISKRSKLNIYEPFQDYALTLPVQLHPNCAHEDGSDGLAKLILEGLGLRKEVEFLVEGIDPEVCKEYTDYIKKEQESNAYQIDSPAEISAGEVFRVKVKLWGDQDHKFKVWSYLYRGSKCYSCSEENVVSLNVNKGDIKTIEMLVKADSDLAGGEYQLMVKVNKDNQKNDKRLTRDIYVKEVRILNESFSVFSSEIIKPEIVLEKEVSQLTGIIVYEDSAEKAKGLISSILFVTFALLSLVLVWKKG